MESFKVKSTCSAVNFCPHFQRRYHYCHNLSLDPTNQGQVRTLSPHSQKESHDGVILCCPPSPLGWEHRDFIFLATLWCTSSPQKKS